MSTEQSIPVEAKVGAEEREATAAAVVESEAKQASSDDTAAVQNAGAGGGDGDEVCKDCGMRKTDFKFCCETGQRHFSDKCPECGLNTKFCPVTGQAHHPSPQMAPASRRGTEEEEEHYSRGIVQDTSESQTRLRQRRVPPQPRTATGAAGAPGRGGPRPRRVYEGENEGKRRTGGSAASSSFLGQGMTQQEREELERTGFGIFLADNPALQRAPLSSAARMAATATSPHQQQQGGGAAAMGIPTQVVGGEEGEEFRRLHNRDEAMDYFNFKAVSEALGAMKSDKAKSPKMFQALPHSDLSMQALLNQQHNQGYGILAKVRENKWKILALFCVIILINSRRLFGLATSIQTTAPKF